MLPTTRVCETLRPHPRIEGTSDVLLPFRANGAIDIDGFRMLLRRTADAGQRRGGHVDFTSVHNPAFGLRAGEIIRKLPSAAVEI